MCLRPSSSVGSCGSHAPRSLGASSADEADPPARAWAPSGGAFPVKGSADATLWSCHQAALSAMRSQRGAVATRVATSPSIQAHLRRVGSADALRRAASTTGSACKNTASRLRMASAGPNGRRPGRLAQVVAEEEDGQLHDRSTGSLRSRAHARRRNSLSLSRHSQRSPYEEDPSGLSSGGGAGRQRGGPSCGGGSSPTKRPPLFMSSSGASVRPAEDLGFELSVVESGTGMGTGTGRRPPAGHGLGHVEHDVVVEALSEAIGSRKRHPPSAVRPLFMQRWMQC
jgi:hypothetical protein